jgi:hypothetical protein
LHDVESLSKAVKSFASSGNSFGEACALTLLAELRQLSNAAPLATTSAPPTAVAAAVAAAAAVGTSSGVESTDESSDMTDTESRTGLADARHDAALLLRAARAWALAMPADVEPSNDDADDADDAVDDDDEAIAAAMANDNGVLSGHERFFGVRRAVNSRLRRVPVAAAQLLTMLGDALPPRLVVTDGAALVRRCGVWKIVCSILTNDWRRLHI